ncbi:MAG: hypothetical protein GX166_14340 [Clostridiaceae bacterium]|nr:hypothetical protein [Clostridiaceae bacterium]HOA30926.1 ArsB/NhaD family transporter [Clostridia bacterium]
MILTLTISATTIICLILSILKYPYIQLKRWKIQSFFLVALTGAAVLLTLGLIDGQEVAKVLFSNSPINPLKILVLFISVSILSIVLDEVGFFSYMANQALKLGKKNQTTLFVVLYAVISILTVFTSNDILILTFTPFICAFAKRANINPIPYLVAEFVSANTFSMMLSIGNPTNIYISSVYGISFFEYMKVMFVPTILAGFCAFLIVFLLFKKEFKKEIRVEAKEIMIKDKFVLVISLIHLILCTIILSISSFLGVEMWLVCLGFAMSLMLILLVYGLINKDLNVLKSSLRRAPWDLVPFVVSMFIIILALDKYKVLHATGEFLNRPTTSGLSTVLTYGLLSTLLSNVLNNIPMTLAVSKILAALPEKLTSFGVYASIIGSNLGAYLTPIGALAGIMFTNILSKENIEYKTRDFIKYGLVTVPFVLIAALFGLLLVL